MAAILNNLTRLGVAVALVGGAANSMLYNGKKNLLYALGNGKNLHSWIFEKR